MPKSKQQKDYEKSRKELQIILKTLKKWIEKNYGKRCKEVGNGCFVCIAWQIYSLLRVYFDK